MTDQEIDRIAERVVNKVLEGAVVSVLDMDGHGLLLHFTEHEILGSARVLDEARAKANPCHCFAYDGRDYCFAKGAIGMLSQEQQADVCRLPKVFEVKPGMKKRFENFSEAAKAAHKEVETVPKGERLEPWLHAMSGELGKRGIQV